MVRFDSPFAKEFWIDPGKVSGVSFEPEPPVLAVVLGAEWIQLNVSERSRLYRLLKIRERGREEHEEEEG